MACVWDFRANEEMFTSEELCKWLEANCKKWVFQKEQGDSGYIHWQGRFSLIKKRLKGVLMKLFKDKVPNYLEPTVTENHQEEFFYAMKEDTRIDGPWFDSSKQAKEVYIPRQYRNIQLYPWQQEILNSHKNFNDRQINCLYQEVGNIGKSTLASIASLKHGAIDMPMLNDAEKLSQHACNIFKDGNIRNSRLMFFDMPKSINKERLYGLYTAIEIIKKGHLIDTRHHTVDWWIDSPTVWVFTNTLPNMNYVSVDRWVIWEVKDNKLVKYNFKEPEPVPEVKPENLMADEVNQKVDELLKTMGVEWVKTGPH